MSTKVVGLVDCFNLPTFGPLTKHRLRASTVFLGRYCYIDFPLSNFRNSGIPSIGILCPGHIRSLSRHVGNGRSWIGNTKIGDFQVLYDEPRISSPGYNTDIACIQENYNFLKSIHPDYVVIASPNRVYEADYHQLLKEHIASGSRISLLYHHVDKGLKTHFIGAKKVTLSVNGNVTHLQANLGDSDSGDVSLASLILDYPRLESLREYAQSTSSFFDLTDVLSYLGPSVLVRGVEIKGYVRCFDSLSHHLTQSLELLDKDVFSSLFKENWPIHTRTYDTPPIVYASGSVVKNCFLANGCKIEGELENCILGRGVVVKKGAKIKNAIISAHSIIGENTTMENVVVDRDAQIIHSTLIKGTLENPVCIERGDIV